MRRIIDPGRERRSINFLDNIPFSTVRDRQGRPLELKLSLMVQNGNSEMRLAEGRDDEVRTGRQPIVVFLKGAGWRACDKNLNAAEMQFLAECGFAVAFPEYRDSSQGSFPAQLQDVKTAIRFLRAHADAYGLDPARAGVIGRSAGGHLAAFCAMNTDGYDTGEWEGVSSRVSACVDLFGAVDVTTLNRMEAGRIRQPGARWTELAQSHGGALLGGGSEEEILKKSPAATVNNFINEGMCPILILHGDQDPLVPVSISEGFYRQLTEAGLEERAELCIIRGAGHGTREFGQPAVKALIADFFREHLGGGPPSKTTHTEKGDRNVDTTAI